MKKIVLLRHGESAWNKENRFTGWTDVDLTEKGVAETEKAGETLKEYGFNFDKAYTSYLKRAVKTLNCVLDKMNLDWIPVEKNWRLNEKHYGELQGLNKAETAEKYGEEQVLVWRRSYDIAPNPLSESDLRNPRFDYRYHEVPDAELPRTESLKDTKVREQLNLPLNSSFYFKVRNKQIHIETTDILAAYPVSDGDYIEIEDVS